MAYGTRTTRQQCKQVLRVEPRCGVLCKHALWQMRTERVTKAREAHRERQRRFATNYYVDRLKLRLLEKENREVGAQQWGILGSPLTPPFDGGSRRNLSEITSLTLRISHNCAS